jgi:hypothetical protein
MKSIICLVVCLVGCVSLSASEQDACKSVPLNFNLPQINAGISAPIAYSTTIDYSSVLGKFADIGTVSATIASNELSSDTGLGWLQSLEVSVQDQAGTMPAVVVAQYNGGQSGNTLELDSMNTGSLYPYFAQGPVKLMFSGMASGLPGNTTDNLCVSATVSKSLQL